MKTKEVKPFVIVIAHKKGGVGKTAKTINITVELQKKGFPLSVIDLDSQKQTTKFNNKRSSNKFNMIDIETSNQLIEYLKQEREEVTIIDLGGYDSDISRTALLLADLVIIPLSDSDNELDGLKEFKGVMNQVIKKRNDIRVKVLVTRVHHADTNTHKALKKFVSKINGFDIFDTVIRSRKEYKRMLSTGKSVSEQTKGSGAIELNKLTNEIINIIK